MSLFTFDIIAQNGDEVGNWMQLLIFVIIIIVSGIASLVKQKAEQPKKTQTQPKGPTAARAAYPQRRTLEDRVRLAAERMQGQIPKAQKAKVGPVLPSIKQEPKLVPFMDRPVAEAAKSQKESAVHDKLGLSDIESLKKAILYYEILGPPVAFRERTGLMG